MSRMARALLAPSAFGLRGVSLGIAVGSPGFFASVRFPPGVPGLAAAKEAARGVSPLPAEGWILVDMWEVVFSPFLGEFTKLCSAYATTIPDFLRLPEVSGAETSWGGA